MIFNKEELIEGAERAQGLTVVIDVFRAFTLEAYMFAAGVKETHPIGSLTDAFALKKAHPDWLLFGERGGAKVPGCDFGNSPAAIKDIDLRGKTVIHSTSAGTQGIIHAVHATQIITGSLVNADAVAEYIRQQAPEVVTTAAMGLAGMQPAKEDEICADYIESRVFGRPFDKANAKKELRQAAAHFFDPSKPQYPEEDFYLSSQFGIFPFVIGVSLENGLYTGKIIFRQ